MTPVLPAPRPNGRYACVTSTLMAMAILALPSMAHSQQSEAQGAAVEAPKVSVTDSLANQTADGSRDQGYSTKTITSVGSWGRLDKLDAPYSFTVIPGALIEDTMASTPNDIFKLMPFSQTTTGTRYGYGAQVQIRGYDSSIELIDGFRTNVGFQSPEMYDRVEVLSGAGGFLYGNAGPRRRGKCRAETPDVHYVRRRCSGGLRWNASICAWRCGRHHRRWRNRRLSNQCARLRRRNRHQQ